MVGKVWTSVVRRVVSEQLTPRASRTPREPAPPAAAGSPSRPRPREPREPASPAAGRRLASELIPLDRVAVVAPQTMALVLVPGEPVLVRRPGDWLRPAWTSSLRPADVLVVNTATVPLDVTLTGLTTLDGRPLARVVLRVSVQLSDHDDHRYLAELAVETAGHVEARLLDGVREEVASQVTAAVRLNRLEDLRRAGLEAVLTDRWLRPAFLGGRLLRRAVSVLEVEWPAAAPAPAPGPERPAAAEPMELTSDARLQRLWRSHVDAELAGIAGAEADGAATVVAVADRRPGAYESSRLREALAEQYPGRAVRVVVAAVTSYEALVRAWFAAVAAGRGTVAASEVSEDGAVLRVTVGGVSGAAGEVGSPADREALRRLLPFGRVEFTAERAR